MNRLAPPPFDLHSQVRPAVDWAIATRRSIRAFLPKPVPLADVEAILDIARFSASGVNMQPWHVHVVTGAAKAELSRAIHEADDDPALRAQAEEPYAYYPATWNDPYLTRRRKVGWDLYGLLGIPKNDKHRMHAQHGRNYSFFGAPVGLFFTLDPVLQEGSLLDYGMFLQSVMVAARARGLHTCPQAAFLKYHQVISRVLGIPGEQTLVCGMSLGHADETRIENTLVTEREPVRAFTKFHHNKKETHA